MEMIIVVIQAWPGSWNPGCKCDYANRKDSHFTGSCFCVHNTQVLFSWPSWWLTLESGRAPYWPLLSATSLTMLITGPCICLQKYWDSQWKRKVYKWKKTFKPVVWIQPTFKCLWLSKCQQGPKAMLDYLVFVESCIFHTNSKVHPSPQVPSFLRFDV